MKKKKNIINKNEVKVFFNISNIPTISINIK